MGRSPCCSKVGLRRGPWSAKEDSLLANYIQQHGEGQWRSLPKKAGLLRCGKSCRLRWMNYLRPGIKRGNISEDEEDLIVRLHRLLGNRWSLIAGRLPGRTDNEIKNYWNTHLLKKLNLINSPNINLNIVKPTTTTKAKKKKQKKKVAPPLNLKSTSFAAAEEDVDDDEANRIHNNSNNNNNMNRTTKVYMPKPIRVSSSVFSRTNSYDSLATSGTSSSGEAAEKVAADYVAWPPLFEVEDDFLGGGCVPAAVLHHHSDSISGDVNMWEKVYDEYMQLL